MPALTPIFFYDEQIRRFLLQFARIFSNFQVEYGRNEEGTEHTLIRVPVRYGDATRQAQTILQENSASGMPATPLMTFYISGLDYDRPRMQEPYFVSKINVRQRTYDETTDSYETTQGNAFTIERLMPVPYKLTLKLDIWTSNTNQKMQIMEQMLVLFNPSLEIQGTDNYIDWTSLSIVELESTQWTSRTIPQGTENPIDVATLTFTLPIWISSPAKVKKLGVVERIVAQMYDAQGDASSAILNNDLLLGTRQVITPYGYQALLIGNKLQALRQPQIVENGSLTPPLATEDTGIVAAPAVDPEIETLEIVNEQLADLLLSAEPVLPANMVDKIEQAMFLLSQVQDYIQAQLDVENNPPMPLLEVSEPLEDISNEADPALAPPISPPSNLMWEAVVGMYGVLRSGISLIRLELEDGSEVTGTISYDPTDNRFLLFDIDEDTIPANTLPPINAVINPLVSGPNEGLNPAQIGQRYLFTEDTGTFTTNSPVAWQGINDEPLVAKANDIVEYDGVRWVVAFDSTSSPNNIQYVTNMTTSIQYKWIDNTWVKSYQGLYPGGRWSLVL
jgi:hypothetical protein